MNLSCLCNCLPEDVVRYILQFDNRIVIRKDVVYFIHKLNKIFYKDSFKLLLEKPLPSDGRTTIYNNELFTWCIVRLKLDGSYRHYISYSSNSKEIVCTLNFWGKHGVFRQTKYIIL